MSEPVLNMDGLREPNPGSTSSFIHGGHTVNVGGGVFNSPGRDINNYYISQPDTKATPSETTAIPNYREIQMDTLAKATEGTCLKIVEGQVFQTWVREGGMLWGTGIPGAGKTTLASVAIDHLQKKAAEAADGQICVAYVYVRYSQPLSVREMLEALVFQLRERHPDVDQLVGEACARHVKERTSPSEKELQAILVSIVGLGKVLFIVLDGLDETSAEKQARILHILSFLKLKLFVLSRPLPKVQVKFPNAVSFRVAAQEDDIRLHINERISNHPDLEDLCVSDSTFKEEMITKIIEKADGMFLHAALQVEALCQCITIQAAMDALDQFPSAVEDAYHLTWRRIEQQPRGQTQLAKYALLWIMHAKREVDLKTLKYMVATSPVTYKFNSGNMPTDAAILSACCGLVQVNQASNMVRLIHFTLKDVLGPLLRRSFPHPHSVITYVCLESLENHGVQDAFRRGIRSTYQSDPLLKYAYDSWSFHATQSLPSAGSRIQAFLEGCTLYPLNSLPNTKDWPLIEFGNGLHVAARDGLAGIIPALSRKIDPNSLTTGFGLTKKANLEDRTPLAVAIESCQQCQLSTIEALLGIPSLDVNCLSQTDQFDLLFYDSRRLKGTPLALAILRCQQEAPSTSIEIVELLLTHPKVDVNFATHNRETPLFRAISVSAWPGLRLLLRAPKLNPNFLEKFGVFGPPLFEIGEGNLWHTPLMHICSEGPEDIMSLLVAHPKTDINFKEPKDGMTVLMIAVKSTISKLSLILQHPGVDVNAINAWGETALARACLGIHISAQTEKVRRLLAFPGIDTSIVPRWFQTETFLSHCMREGWTELAGLFEEHEAKLAAAVESSSSCSSDDSVYDDALDDFPEM